MKIAFIIPSLINQGPIIVVNTLVKHLINKVEKIDIYYFDDKVGLDFPCPTYKINFNTRINFELYDIVHSHMYRPDKYVAKWRKSILGNIKTISTIHQDIFQSLKYTYNLPIAIVFNLIWKSYLKKMDTVTVISQKLLSIYSDLPKATVVYNGININYNSNKADSIIIEQIKNLRNNGRKIIGTYAQITKIKGIDQLTSLLDIRDDFALVIIGEGKAKSKLINTVHRKGHDSRVLFLPYLQQPYNYLNYFDIYAMPSRNEGFGLAIAEAALTHTPIICSNIEVFHEIFDKSEVCFFDLNDLNSLSNAVNECLLSGKQKVDKAYLKIRSKFSGEIMSNNYFNLYNK